MNKFFYYSLLLSICLQSCHKHDDDNNPPPIEKDCKITSQTGFDYLVDAKYGTGFKKTYSPDGKISELIVSSFTGYENVDTVTYSVRYLDDLTIRLTPVHYSHPSERGPADSIDVILNSKGFATQTIDYSNLPGGLPIIVKFSYDASGKLDSAQWDENPAVRFSYDDSGNLIKIKTPSSFFEEVDYTYDYSKKAKNQIYVTTGFNFGVYNLVEILNLIPIAHKNICTSQRIFRSDLYFDETFTISNHTMDNYGNLTSFQMMVSSIGESKTITNAVHCED